MREPIVITVGSIIIICFLYSYNAAVLLCHDVGLQHSHGFESYTFTFQVEVILDDIPSSCRGGNCAFNFIEEATVHFIEPDEGQGGTEIMISGSDFTTTVGDITVTIGSANCMVTYANESHIVCTAGGHPAGQYKVSVHIQGRGYASMNESVCFHYLLSIDSVSPQVLSIGGSERVVISGNGFINFVRFDVSEPHSTFPWFEFGFGIPDVKLEDVCPYFEGAIDFQFPENITNRNRTVNFTRLIIDGMNRMNFDQVNGSNRDFSSQNGNSRDQSFETNRLQSFLRSFYSRFPASAEIGGAPCIIISANLTQIECVTTTVSLPTRSNLIVTVLTETDTLENAVEFSINETAFINMIDPLTGPTFGGTLLTISGSNFLKDPSEEDRVKVTVGSEECVIQNVNDTHIQCLTSPHEPGYVSILVSTANGIAISRSTFTAQPQQNTPQSGMRNVLVIQDQSASGDGTGSGSEDASQRGSGDSPASVNGYASASGSGDSSVNGSRGTSDRRLPPFIVFHYQLEVTEIQPLTGSVLGGTVVRIFGLGFSMERTAVYIGIRSATLLNVNATLIECDTPTSTQSHAVYFQNRGFGGDFQLNKHHMHHLVLTAATWEL